MDLVLTPAEIGKFQEALLSAFNRSELVQFIYFRLAFDLNDVIADGPYRQVVTDLIKWANSQGKVEALLRRHARKTRATCYCASLTKPSEHAPHRLSPRHFVSLRSRGTSCESSWICCNRCLGPRIMRSEAPFCRGFRARKP